MFQGNEIWHGDSRKLAPKVPNDINAIITDPPYGMDFKSNNTKTAKNDKHAQKIAGDGDMDEAIALFNEVVVKTLVPKCTDEAEMYVFTAWHILDVWIPLVKAIPEFELKMMLIWQKGYPGLGDLEGNWGCGYEPILYLKKGRRPLPYRRQGILAFDKIASGQNIHPCLPPEELVLTDQGYRPISKVSVGDSVYSHDGKFHPVIDTTEHPCKGKVVEVVVEKTSQTTRTTGNHPWLIYRPIKKVNAIVGATIGWLNADEVVAGDYTMTPRMEVDEAECEFTVDQAWAAGLWLAEGSFLTSGHGTNRYLQYALHKKETAYVDRLQRTFPDVNVRSYSKPESNGVQVVAFESRMAEKFYAMFGKGSHNKTISLEVLNWPIEHRQALLDGYLDGDGWRMTNTKYPHVTRVKTVSDDLATFITLLAEGLGKHVASFRAKPPKVPAVIAGREIRGDGHWALEIRDPIERLAKPMDVVHEGITYTLRRVKSAVHVDYEGPVINLTVEDAHTFQTCAGMTHNTEKPVPLLEQLIEMSYDPGDFVVDPFAGSGSTIKAAQNLDRNALGIERDPEFHRGASERLTVMGFEF